MPIAVKTIAAKPAAGPLTPILDPLKNPSKQYTSCFTEIAQWYNKQKELEKPVVDRLEIKNIIELYNKFKSNKLEVNDQLVLNYPDTQLSTEL